MLGLDDNMTLLVLSSRAMKMMSQDVSGGSSLTRPKPFVFLLIQQRVFPFVFILYLKEPFYMGSKSIRDFVSLLCSSFSIAPPSPGNTITQGDLMKSCIVPMSDKPM